MGKNIGIIGFGSMGSMLLNKFITGGVVCAQSVFVSTRSADKSHQIETLYPNVHVCETNSETAQNVDILFLCLKPTDLQPAITGIISHLKSQTHIISLNGSVLFTQLESLLPHNAISKVIPSITAEVNESQTLVCHNGQITDTQKEFLKEILCSFGSVIELEEHEMGMGSELVSCMPGFLAAVFNEFVNAALLHTSIDRTQVIQMLLNTVHGTSNLMISKNMSFADVEKRVATKGGITEVGTEIIHRDIPNIARNVFEKTIKKREAVSKQSSSMIVQ